MVTVLVSLDPGAVVPVPSLSRQQRALATAGAVAARRERAAVKQELKQGRRSLRSVVVEGRDVPAIARMRVHEVLEAMPGTGPVRAEQIMADLGIARSRRVRGLGQHQTQSLIERFEQA